MEDMLKETLQMLVDFHENELAEAYILKDRKNQLRQEAKVSAYKKALQMVSDEKELCRMHSLLS